MRALLFIVLAAFAPSLFAQQFDRTDWKQSAVIEERAMVVLFNPVATQIDQVRIVEVAHVFFTGEGVMGYVAFDCASPHSSFDLQWGELIDGVVRTPTVARPTVPFGLTPTSRSTLASKVMWGQVCLNALYSDFPSNVLWDEALLHVRTQNKQWRKRFEMDKSVWWSLEKQYKQLPEDQRGLKLQILNDKKIERAELKTSHETGRSVEASDH